MKKLTAILAISLVSFNLQASTWGTWNGKTVGTASGNASSLNGKTIGTASGNIGSFNGMTSPASGASYTGQTCAGGQSASNVSTQACSAQITLSTNDYIFLYSTNGDNVALSSCTTGTGTATITWTVVASFHLWDATNGQGIDACVGNVTSGGTATPTANWGSNTGFTGVIAAAFSGTQRTSDGSTSHQNTGSSSTNGNTSGNITTTTNGDLLTGGLVDTAGSAATVTAGTTSVTFTKIACSALSTANLCIEWGSQTTAGAGTGANWTLSNTDRTVAGIVTSKI
jgi:hypothetical protein